MKRGSRKESTDSFFIGSSSDDDDINHMNYYWLRNKEISNIFDGLFNEKGSYIFKGLSQAQQSVWIDIQSAALSILSDLPEDSHIEQIKMMLYTLIQARQMAINAITLGSNSKKIIKK
jgi:hypothetical protein